MEIRIKTESNETDKKKPDLDLFKVLVEEIEQRRKKLKPQLFEKKRT